MLLLPMPDQDGIEKTKAIVKARTGRDVTDEEAAQLLGRVMRYQYLLRLMKQNYEDAVAKGEWPPP